MKAASLVELRTNCYKTGGRPRWAAANSNLGHNRRQSKRRLPRFPLNPWDAFPVQVLFRHVLLISIAVATPVIPFLLFGEQMEQWAREWVESEHGYWVTVGGVILLLAGDIFLPTPSSLITTMAGWQLGTIQGTVVSWVGMTLGAAIGFGLARRFGRPLARWLSDERDLERMQRLNNRTGPMLLLLTRAVPVLAEASVVLVGVNQLTWRKFLPPVIVANFVISLAYAGFGEIADANEWFPLAVIAAILIPIATSIGFQRFLARSDSAEESVAQSTTQLDDPNRGD